MTIHVIDPQHPGIQRISPGEARGTPAEKAPDPDLGTELIPKTRYTDPDYMKLEWERLWTKVWNYGCAEQQLPNPGDYYVTELGKEQIILVKQTDGTYRGFYNVCLHRGNRLCIGACQGHAESFQCDYHHFEWNIDGTLKRIPDRETFPQQIKDANLKLKEVKVDTWGGWVFFSLNPNVEPLRDYLGMIPEHLDPYAFDQQKLIDIKTIEWDCNWKTSVDAFNETYHVQGIHPELMLWLDDYFVQIDCYEKHNRYLVPFVTPSPRYDWRKMNETLTMIAQMTGLDPNEYEGNALELRRAVQLAKRKMENDTHFPYKNLNDDQLTDDYHYMIFPNITMNIYAEAVMVFVSRPHATDPNKMLFDLINFAHIDPEADHQLPERKTYKHGQFSLGLVLDQDAYNLPEVQKGMNSDAYEGLLIGNQELRIRHFHKTLTDYVDPDGSLGV